MNLITYDLLFRSYVYEPYTTMHKDRSICQRRRVSMCHSEADFSLLGWKP